MSKSLKTTFILVFISLVFMLSACSNNKVQSFPENKPSDFNFVLNYGVDAKNQLDTQKGTYTKDMFSAPSVTTALKLSDKDMNEIYKTMRSINILSYPEKFNPKSNMCQTPFQTYSIKIMLDGKEKSIYWKDENVSNDKDAVKLRDLFARIDKIVSEKDEYKKLPQPQGGYL